MSFKIQFLTENRKFSKNNNEMIDLSTLDEPKSFDEYHINIIDLSNENLWKNCINCKTTIDRIKDFLNLNSIIRHSRTSKIFIILPQDLEYYYNYGFNGGTVRTYGMSERLKNMLRELETIINSLYSLSKGILAFEPTKTHIGDYDLVASFYFLNSDPVTKSIQSEKTTTVNYANTYITTVKIENIDHLISFLNQLKLIQENDCAPDWISDINILSDKKHKEIIDNEIAKIREAEINITQSQDVLNINNRYKSILYSNGDLLVSVVFDILQKILGYDLTSFVDEKKEDFIIRFPEVTFIGEIKGVSSNLKSEHISQLDVHLQGYNDSINTTSINENTKSILIINHQRQKPVSNREPVHETQIKLAVRNNSLIIETTTLLKILEMSDAGKLDCAQIINLLSKKSGLLTFE